MPLSSLNVSSSDRSLSLLIAPYRSLHPESGVGKQESGITGCMVSDTVDDITPSNRALPGLLRLSGPAQLLRASEPLKLSPSSSLFLPCRYLEHLRERQR